MRHAAPSIVSHWVAGSGLCCINTMSTAFRTPLACRRRRWVLSSSTTGSISISISISRRLLNGDVPIPLLQLHLLRHSLASRLFATKTTNPSSSSSSKISGATHTKASSDPTPTIMPSSAVSVSLFKNPIVHELWTARQRAKQELSQNKGPSNASTPSTTNSNSNSNSNSPSTSLAPPPSKSPADSRVAVSYPFATDPLLWETYRNPWGQMRLGKVLEDLDALAGNIAFFHVVMQNQQQTNNNNSATTESFVPESEYPVIVTASVDRIRLHSRPRVAGSDQHLSGQVTWTGTSSMEIRMTCTETTTPSSETTHPWLEAYVTFVTLDPHTKKPRRIPAIVPVTEEEKREFAQGEARAEAKKQRRKRNHQTSSSNQDDSSNTVDTTAQALLAQAGPLLTMPSLADPHSILLKDTVMQNAMIAQPQAQNLHNRIFGGFLVRRAFELAFANAYLFGGARPIFLEVDEVSFARPVDVGDLLVFHSRVLYTENKAGHLRDYYQQQQPNDDGDDNDKEQDTPIGALIHIEVEAWVTEPEKVSAHISNQFYFTFAVAQKPGQTSATPAVRKVLPSNIDEARRVAIRMQVDAEQAKCDP